MASNVVLVTGCSAGGIGFKLCEEFASRGCTVYATSRRLSSMQGFTSPRIRTKELDVRSEENVTRVANEVISEAGRIDILVSNAAIMDVGPILDIPLDRVQQAFDTNTFGTLRLARVVIPHMAERRSGLCLIIGSVGGVIPTPWTGVYAASKAALHSIADNLYMECRPLGINVMLLAPGGVKSQIAKNSSEHHSLPENSLYQDYSESIIARMWTSQTSLSMSTATFTKKVVDQALKRRPPGYFSIGGGAIIWKAFSWLPRWAALSMFWRWFGQQNKKRT